MKSGDFWPRRGQSSPNAFASAPDSPSDSTSVCTGTGFPPNRQGCRRSGRAPRARRRAWRSNWPIAKLGLVDQQTLVRHGGRERRRNRAQLREASVDGGNRIAEQAVRVRPRCIGRALHRSVEGRSRLGQPRARDRPLACSPRRERRASPARRPHAGRAHRRPRRAALWPHRLRAAPEPPGAPGRPAPCSPRRRRGPARWSRRCPPAPRPPPRSCCRRRRSLSRTLPTPCGSSCSRRASPPRKAPRPRPAAGRSGSRWPRGRRPPRRCPRAPVRARLWSRQPWPELRRWPRRSRQAWRAPRISPAPRPPL